MLPKLSTCRSSSTLKYHPHTSTPPVHQAHSTSATYDVTAWCGTGFRAELYKREYLRLSKLWFTCVKVQSSLILHKFGFAKKRPSGLIERFLLFHAVGKPQHTQASCSKPDSTYGLTHPPHAHNLFCNFSITVIRQDLDLHGVNSFSPLASVLW